MNKEEQTICTTCGVPLTVQHLLTECRKTEASRNKHNIPEFLHQSLGQDEKTIKNTLL